MKERHGGAPMSVDVIDSYESFLSLQQVWDSVWDRDPETDYFHSWRWLSEVFRANPGRWQVLAVRPDGGSDYVCFFPIRVIHRWSRSLQESVIQLETAGRLSWGQYAGFVCDPKWEKQGLPAVAAHLGEMPWSFLTLKYWSSSVHRMMLFLGELPESGYEVTHREYLSNRGTVNNLICPYVELPDDYETYLASSVSANTRQKIRRFSRRLEASQDLHITITDSDTFDRNLGILLDMWKAKWTSPRGREEVEEVAEKYREILAQSHACDAVFLPVLWRGTTPLGALANIVDRRGRRSYFIAAGRDEAAAEPFIGLMLHSFSIRWAIENGVAVYDLCHGNEDYKYSLGATDRRVAYVTIRRRSAAS